MKHLFILFFSSSFFAIGQNRPSNLVKKEKYFKFSIAQYSVYPASFFTDTNKNSKYTAWEINPVGLGLALGTKINFKKKTWITYSHELNYSPFKGMVINDNNGQGIRVYKDYYTFHTLTYGSKFNFDIKKKVFISIFMESGLLFLNYKHKNEAFEYLKFVDSWGNKNIQPLYLNWGLGIGLRSENILFDVSFKDNILRQFKKSDDILEIIGIVFSSTYYFKKS